MQCYSPVSIKDPAYNKSAIRLSVPCGKCPVCLQNRANDWSIRLYEESKVSSSSHFVTLTYDDDNLVFKEVLDKETGEILFVNTVVKKHLQDYIKRLRTVTDNKLRYYAISEYGETTYRPHYHIIMLNLPHSEMHQYQTKWYYGHVYIGSVQPASIQYVAQYHVTKNIKPDGADDNFVLMSRRPGIGSAYLDRMKKWHDTGNYDRGYYPQYDVKRRLPRYYRDKLYDEQTREHFKDYFVVKDDITEQERLTQISEIQRRANKKTKTKL